MDRFASTGLRKDNRCTSALRSVATVPSNVASETFYSNEHDSFVDLGVSPAVEEALVNVGFTRPSNVQELAAPHVLRGRNVVIAAETGSGKTLSYLIPIAHLMLKQRVLLEKQKQQLEMEKQKQERDGAQGQQPDTPARSQHRRYHALVLCPNVALCQQVVKVANSLRTQDGTQVLTAALVNNSNPPPFDTPDVIVATPAGLRTLLENAQGAYGWLWTEDGLQARVRHVVVDEADLLLGDAYAKATQGVLTMFKVFDRRRVESKLFEELGITEKWQYDRLPRPFQTAGWRGGVPAMLAAGYKHDKPLDPDAKYGPYWRRQYIYAAATMPTNTYADVGSWIERAHPDAVWVSTELLHQSKPEVEHTWQEVTDKTYAAALLSAIRNDPDYQARRGKTLVFAADGATADAVSDTLTGGSVPHVVYHKSRPMAEQQAALETLRTQEGTVMVCTDAAARGLDVLDIRHVVQATFAANTIDFIHRIGRTARAGHSGRVTSLYRENARPLVEVIRKFIEEGVPLQSAFSRARSFRNNMRKSGGVFVPRGAKRARELAGLAPEERGRGAGADKVVLAKTEWAE